MIHCHRWHKKGLLKAAKNHLAFTQLYCLLLLVFLSTAWSLSWARSPCSFAHQIVGPLPENKQKGLNCSAEWPQEALQPLDEVPPLCVCLTRTLALLFGIILNKPALREQWQPFRLASSHLGPFYFFQGLSISHPVRWGHMARFKLFTAWQIFFFQINFS